MKYVLLNGVESAESLVLWLQKAILHKRSTQTDRLKKIECNNGHTFQQNIDEREGKQFMKYVAHFEIAYLLPY